MLFGPKFVTLTFTDTAIKAAAARPSRGGFKISHLAKKALPAGTVFNGNVTNADLFREAIKAFFLENFDSLKTRSLVLGLNEQEVFLTGISFPQKPKDLGSKIKEAITPNLPYEPKTAAITYKEVSANTYQVAVTKSDTLRFLSGVFKEAGFSLKAIVPPPLVFPRLAETKQEAFLFVSSEEDLVYSLVVKNAVVFTSTLYLKKPLVEDEKEIITTASEIIGLERERLGETPLKNVFIHGKNADFLKGFFVNNNFDVQIISTTDKWAQQIGYDVVDFARVLALSTYDSSVLAFPKVDSITTVQSSDSSIKKKSYGPLYFIFLLLAVGAAGIIFFGSEVKNLFFKGDRAEVETTTPKASTGSTVPKAKEVTESGKNEATSSAETAKQIDKSEFKVQVLNGSGEIGAAGSARDFLVAKGYNVVSVGNADNFNYSITTVRIKSSKKGVSDLLTKDLRERYDVDIDSPLTEGEQFDIIIIIGG